MGLTLDEMDQLTEGMIFDMFSEASNDTNGDYQQIATQEDFDRF
nr:MAG TPA: hypothetical protein [Caudoviricetes sp.]